MDDRAEIVELLHRYAILTDRRDLDGVGALFTEDGQATYSGVRLEPGRAAIVAHLQGLRDIPMTQHDVGTTTITVDGDTATATSYTQVHAVRSAGDGHEILHRGLSYDDRLVRTTEGWRFAERYHQVLWMTSEPIDWPIADPPLRSAGR